MPERRIRDRLRASYRSSRHATLPRPEARCFHVLCEESLLQSGVRVGSKPDSHVCVSDAIIGSFVITAVQKWITGDKHDKVAHLTFRDLLTAFAAAVEANDGEGLASLFTEDGTYEDGFFGAHTGRAGDRHDVAALSRYRPGLYVGIS